MRRRTLAMLMIGILMVLGFAGCGGGHDKVDRGEDSYAMSLYNAKNPYIENTSANNDLVRLLGVNSIGKYTLNVIDDDHPFTLEIRFMYLHGDVDQASLQQRMTNIGVALMSLIRDCEQVNWSYPSDAGLVEGTIGVDYANEILATDLKAAGKDEAKFAALCERLFPDKMGAGDGEASEEGAQQ